MIIKIFSDYFDKKGHRYKVLSFDGSRYACESYLTGKNHYFSSNELFDKPPKKQSDKISELENNKSIEREIKYSEPVYEAEVIIEEPKSVGETPKKEEKTAEPVQEIKEDNIRETAEDFYADL